MGSWAFPHSLPHRRLTGPPRTPGHRWGRIPVGILDYLTMSCFFLSLMAQFLKH